MKKVTPIILLLFLVTTETLWAQTSRKSGLTNLLEAEAAKFTLRSPDENAPTGVIELESFRDRKPLGVGIYVKHLTTGEEAMVQPDVVFETQSVIKIPILVRAYQLADEKKLDLDERVRLTKSDFNVGSGVLQFHQEGSNPTLRDLLTEMIITSDNTATDIMLARIGGTAALNSWLLSSGYTEARMATNIFESFRFTYEIANPAHKSLTVAQVYALRTNNPSWAGLTQEWLDSIHHEVSALEARPLAEVRTLARERGLPFYFGRMTPREAGRLLQGIERATFASKEASAEMKQMLQRQQAGARRLPHFIDYPVGHKTGDSSPWDANDVGIIYAPSGPIIVAVFTNDLGGSYKEEEDKIGRIGRLIVDYFEGKH